MRARSRWARSLASTLVLLLGLSGAAMAHGGGGEGCERGAKLNRFEGRLEGLDLDPQTLAAARELLDKAREEGQASRDEMRSARDHMHELLNQEKPDVGAVLAQADTIGALQTAAKKARLRTLLEVRALLTPEQWAQLIEPPPGGPKHHRRGLSF